MRATDWLKTSGNVIAYYPRLAKPLGSVNAAILFGQLFYWQDKATSDLGVYKTQEEIENETGLSRREQESARKNLRDRGILIETHKRLEHRLYFKLDLDKFNEMMEKYAAVSQCNNEPSANGGNVQPPMAETDIREATKPPFVIQEITTEITTQDNNHLNPPAAEKSVDIFSVRNEIANLIEGKFNHDSAKALHDDVEIFLKSKGFSVEREYRVDDRGDGRPGRVDLVVEYDGQSIGIELDHKSPRNKSLYKLNNFPASLVILRSGSVGKRYEIGSTMIITASSQQESDLIDYQAVMEAYNDVNEATGSRLPFAETLSDERKREIKKFLLTLKNLNLDSAREHFEGFFSIARPFYFGENDREWVANFDYVIQPKIVVKVSEGSL